jgi:hypothetical protein
MRTRGVALPGLALICAAACGGGGSSIDAGGDDGDDAMPPDAGPPTCDAPATFADGIAPTQILHVAAGASPGGDGSMGNPFGTIEEAAAAATPGTAIRLGPGNHTTGQYVQGLAGTAAAPIWIGGEPGQNLPVFDGGGQAMQLVQPKYVVVHDLEVRGATANGINIDDGGDFDNELAAHHVAVQGVYIHDIGTGGNNDCLKVSGINDLYVYDSRFERCGGGGSGSGIDHVGCHRSIVARNVFDDISGNAVQAKGGSTDVDVRQNRIRDIAQRAINLGGSTDLTLFRPSLSMSSPNAEARRIRVFDNVFTGTMSAPVAFVGCVDCLVAHNLVRGDMNWLVRILQETPDGSGGYPFEPARTGRVINNSFVFLAGTLSTHVNVGGGTDPGSFTFSHDLWLASDNPGQSAPDLPVAEDGGVIGMASGYASFPDDPRAPAGTLCGGGEVGAAAALPEIAGTLDGACRAARADIGPLIEDCP